MGNLTDLTGMTDATLDAFMAVKGGEDVTVDHLTPAERARLCEALGVKAPWYWLSDGAAPIADGPVEGRGRRFDYEGAILARQEREDTEAGRY